MAHLSDSSADPVAACAEALRRAVDGGAAIAALTGRDLAAASGSPPLLAAEEPWRDRKPEQLATPEAFDGDPRQVWEWYAWQRDLAAQAEPGPAHRALAEIERRATEFVLITESTDGLHQRAGSRAVVEVRGSIWRMRCPQEGALFTDTRVPLPELPPRCSCGAVLRPDVVWYGESLPPGVVEEALEAATGCDFLLAAATSRLAQPAASLPLTAKRAGATVIEVNPELTRISWAVDAVLLGSPEELLPRLWPTG
jgi:NAD-dependent deacetylase